MDNVCRCSTTKTSSLAPAVKVAGGAHGGKVVISEMVVAGSKSPQLLDNVQCASAMPTRGDQRSLHLRKVKLLKNV